MPRPKGSDKFKLIALEFARAVTVHSTSTRCYLAKTGPYSLFSLFCTVMPKACNKICRKDGVSQCEFNKLLLRNGFINVRTRISRVMR
jgi:hypothetical protein